VASLDCYALVGSHEFRLFAIPGPVVEFGNEVTQTILGFNAEMRQGLHELAILNFDMATQVLDRFENYTGKYNQTFRLREITNNWINSRRDEIDRHRITFAAQQLPRLI